MDDARTGVPEGALRLAPLDVARDGAAVGVVVGSGGSSDGCVDVRGERVLPIRCVIGVGRNYRAHADEQGVDVPERPMLFTKNPASCCLDGDAIRIPASCLDREQVDYEGELAVVLGRACRDVAESTVLDAFVGERAAEGGVGNGSSPVLGFCVGNDVSARWWQKSGSGGQFMRGKSFDTFCPLGPWVTPVERVGDVRRLSITTRLNGEVVQDSTTEQMIFGVSRLIAECSRETTLLPGTVLLTGTPGGVGMAQAPPRFLREGDVVEVSVERLGVLRNVVVSA